MTLTLGALCLAAVAALLNVSVGTNLSAEGLLATLQSATNLQASSEIFFDCMKAIVPFVLLLAIGQRMWAQAIATAMVMGAIVFHSLPPVPAYADQLLPYRLGVFISSPQTLAEAPIDSTGAIRFGRYQ